MLGERGMWFKFNPYEQSIKVPPIIHAPRASAARRVGVNCSLVGLLSTLLDLATDGPPPALAEHCDGRSPSALLHGSDPQWTDEALIEFTAEGVHAPALILCQGASMYVHCEGHPGMLFDLKNDPSELRNLCADPGCKIMAGGFAEDIQRRFDPAGIKREVLASQKRRLFLHGTLVKGTHTPWDYEPRKDAARQYVRSVRSTGTSTPATTAKARFPFVPSVSPDTPRKLGVLDARPATKRATTDGGAELVQRGAREPVPSGVSAAAPRRGHAKQSQPNQRQAGWFRDGLSQCPPASRKFSR